jgi:hypothetical protein
MTTLGQPTLPSHDLALDLWARGMAALERASRDNSADATAITADYAEATALLAAAQATAVLADAPTQVEYVRDVDQIPAAVRQSVRQIHEHEALRRQR